MNQFEGLYDKENFHDNVTDIGLNLPSERFKLVYVMNAPIS